MIERKDQIPLRGYFGKLPVFNDFVKYNAGNEEILILDKWLQEGIILVKQKLKNDWKSIYKNSLPLRFFYPFTGTENFVSGIIFPSNDRSDREFPFLIFFLLNKSFFDRAPFYLIPLIFSNDYNSFEEIFNNINNNTSVSNLNEFINQISTSLFEVTPGELYQTFINDSLQKDFWQRIFRDPSNEKKYNMVNNIFNPEIKNSTVALKFNFYSDNENNVLDICFLLNVIALSKNNFFLPAMFWTKNINNEILLYMFPSQPAPVNYLDMLYSTEKNDRIFKVEDKTVSNQVSPLDVDHLNQNETKLIITNEN